MFYYIFIFIIVSFFLLYKERKNHAMRYSILIMACYTMALIAFTLYISKDSYYYNTIDDLFSIPLPIWNKMMFISVPLDVLIRLLNFFTLAAVFCSIQFAFTYTHYNHTKRYSHIILGILTGELILYDPKIYEILYLHTYPFLLNYRQFSSVQKILHIATVTINGGIILAGLWLFWVNYKKASPIRIFKISAARTGLCHALIMISFLLIFGYYPVTLVKVSKIAGLTSYITAPMISDKRFTMLFPYYLLLSFILICFCIYRTSKITSQLEDESFTISKQISAADTTSKAFCHYVKNEVLAIQSEIEMIDAAEEQKEAFQNIEKRCKYLYERLDFLYRNSKASALTLKEVNIDALLKRMIDNFSYELHGYTVYYSSSEEGIHALLDETYFYQALYNVVSNALEAMDPLPAPRKTLTISLSVINSWICIRITDTGKGIAGDELSKIFTPFYSSYPIKTHWGIGLSLTYKIIEAHEGHIDIESKKDAGTTVKILLPQIHKQ